MIFFPRDIWGAGGGIGQGGKVHKSEQDFCERTWSLGDVKEAVIMFIESCTWEYIAFGTSGTLSFSPEAM